MDMIAQVLEGVVFYGWVLLTIPATLLAVWILIYMTKECGKK